MVQKDLVFSCLEDSYGGQLTPEDVHLFYYDIGFDSEMGHSIMYSWDNEIELFKAENNLIIDDCDITSMPTTIKKNEMFFIIEKCDNNNKAIAFFRHLRNAFTHYHIGLSGEYYYMKDFYSDNKTVTMIGKVHTQTFRELINVFFKQKSKAEEESNKYYYPEK